MKNSVRFVISEYFAYANFIKTLNEYCSNWGGGGRALTWGRRGPEAADKIAFYRVKVFLFELF